MIGYGCFCVFFDSFYVVFLGCVCVDLNSNLWGVW